MWTLCSPTEFCTLHILVNKESWGLEMPASCEKQLGSEFFPFNSLKTFCPLMPKVVPKILLLSTPVKCSVH